MISDLQSNFVYKHLIRVEEQNFSFTLVTAIVKASRSARLVYVVILIFNI